MYLLGRTVLLGALGTLVMVGCSGSEGTEQAPSSQPTATAPSSAAPTIPLFDTLPQLVEVPPVEPAAFTFVNEVGDHCVRLRRSTGINTNMCVDEADLAADLLAVSTTEPDADGTIYVAGLTSSESASHVIVEAGPSSFRVELRAVANWRDRVFVAPVPVRAEVVLLVDTNGAVIAEQHL